MSDRETDSLILIGGSGGPDRVSRYTGQETVPASHGDDDDDNDDDDDDSDDDAGTVWCRAWWRDCPPCCTLGPAPPAPGTGNRY